MIITSPRHLAEGKAAKVSSVGSCFLISPSSCVKQRNWTAYIVSLSACPQRALQLLHCALFASTCQNVDIMNYCEGSMAAIRAVRWVGGFICLTGYSFHEPGAWFTKRSFFFFAHRALPQEGHWQGPCYHRRCRTHGEVSVNSCGEQGSFLEVSTTQNQFHLKQPVYLIGR